MTAQPTREELIAAIVAEYETRQAIRRAVAGKEYAHNLWNDWVIASAWLDEIARAALAQREEGTP